MRTVERLVPLTGAMNFRDVGGYSTTDGRQVRWGRVFRSAELHALGEQDRTSLEALNVQVIYDLRSTRERADKPDRWPTSPGPRMVGLPYDDSAENAVAYKEFALAVTKGQVDVAKARETLRAVYPRLLDSHATQFREIFLELLAAEGAVLYHCAAGKDRTGVMTALLLSVLGVSRDQVMADYLLSNTYYKLDVREVLAEAAKAEKPSIFAYLPPEVLAVFLSVEAGFLDALLEKVQHNYGGIEGYLQTKLGLGPADVARLKALYLE